MKHTIEFALAFLIAGIAGPAYPDVWSLDKTVRAAVAASKGAEINRLDAASSLADVVSARMAWRPTVSVSANANYVDKVMEISFGGRNIRFGDYDTYDFKLRLNQLLFDGGRLDALRDAGSERAATSMHQAETTELTAELQAKTAFFEVALAKETIAASDESIREAQNHYADVTALHDQGMALDDDVLLSRLRISQAEMTRVTCDADLERAYASFRRVTGLPPESEVSIDWTPSAGPEPAANAETAYKNRPEFKALQATLGAADKTAESARAGHLPTVGLSGAFNYGKPGLDQTQSRWMHYLTGGVSLNWNVWDWGAVNRDVQKADIARQKTEQSIEDLKLSVGRQVSEAMAGYTESSRRASLAEESAEYARLHLQLVNDSFKNGVATERDYDSAHALFTRALHDAAAAKIGLEMSRAQIDYVLGIRYGGAKP
jgi:outer membrane protein